MNKLALSSKIAVVCFVSVAIFALSAAVIGYLRQHKLDFFDIVAALFLLFAALYTFKYGKKLKNGDSQ